MFSLPQEVIITKKLQTPIFIHFTRVIKKVLEILITIFFIIPTTQLFIYDNPSEAVTHPEHHITLRTSYLVIFVSI